MMLTERPVATKFLCAAAELSAEASFVEKSVLIRI